MWIPSSTEPRNSDVRLAVITSAQALGAALGENTILHKVYEQLVEEKKDGVPSFVKVCTHHYEGEGVQLTPVEAYHLNKLGLLGEEQGRSQGGFGMTDYTRHFSWRMLNVAKLYDLLSDKTLPAPTQEAEIVNED